jgi:hypothetical protein
MRPRRDSAFALDQTATHAQRNELGAGDAPCGTNGRHGGTRLRTTVTIAIELCCRVVALRTSRSYQHSRRVP